MEAEGRGLDRALQALLESTAVDSARRPEIEALLTDGYARVLELEAERRRFMALIDCGDAADDVTRELVSLRDRLDEATRRFGGGGERDLDRRPLSEGRAHKQGSP
jgi:hypothetical protein